MRDSFVISHYLFRQDIAYKSKIYYLHVMNYIKFLYEKSDYKSVKEFAKDADISERTMNSYIYENRDIPLSKFIKICKSLNLDFEKFINQ